MNNNPFRPHQFTPQNPSIRLYHVWDANSRTPCTDHGIQCGDPDNYFINAWHAITPRAIRRHLDWRNRSPTQFISFSDDLERAFRERDRRDAMPGVRPGSVRIAVVDLDAESRVWVFNKTELMRMMQTFGGDVQDIYRCMSRDEWLVWGDVPIEYVQGEYR